MQIFFPGLSLTETSLIASTYFLYKPQYFDFQGQICLKHRSDNVIPLLKNIQCFSLPYRIKYKFPQQDI